MASIGARMYVAKSATGTPNDDLAYKIQTNSGLSLSGQGLQTGFKGTSRTSGTSINVRSSQTTTTTSNSVGTTLSGFIFVFSSCTSANIPNAWTDARMSFYSMGRGLDLSLLDTRITTLMTTLNALL